MIGIGHQAVLSVACVIVICQGLIAFEVLLEANTSSLSSFLQCFVVRCILTFSVKTVMHVIIALDACMGTAQCMHRQYMVR